MPRKDKQKLSEYNKEYYKKNRAKISIQRQQRRKRDYESIREWERAYYKKNKERIQANIKRWNQEQENASK